MAIWFFLLIPSLALWLTTGPLEGSVLQLPVLIGSKIALVAIPVLYRNTADTWSYKGSRGQLTIGVTSGLLLAGILASVYSLLSGLLDLEQFRQGVGRLGVSSVTSYILMALFWSFINAFTEEVFWRWFAIGQLKKRFNPNGAIVVSAVFFSFHHGIATSLYFPVWMVVGAMFATCTAGILWGYMYHHSKSIFAPFISHVIADIAIFSFGYILMFS